MKHEIKYPRTLHLPWSLGVTSDDKFVTEDDLINYLDNKDIIITEKRDGENTTMRNDKIHARSLDSNNHPSRSWVKGLWGNIRHEIPSGWRICGENLYAKHSLFYSNLETYFEVFSIWDENGMCLDWDQTEEYCHLFGLKPVPVLFEGKFDLKMLKSFHKTLDLDKQEGFVIRLKDSFHHDDFHKSIFKWVRENHVQTNKHWSNQPIIPNLLLTNC